jgi:pimeloyl-ACP methyl ester carboxylesterase
MHCAAHRDGPTSPPCTRTNVRRHASDRGPTRAVTVVLIHGGGATGAFWDRLVPLLDAPPLVIDLPGRRGRPAALETLTVEEEVASVVADVEAGAPEGPVTLVAHSSGGLVVPGVVAALDGRVGAIVLNAALVPAEGECGVTCMQERHGQGLRAAVAAAEEEGRSIILPAPSDPEALRRSYGGDPLDDATLAFVTDPERSVADTVHHYFQPVHWSAAAGVPVTYVLNERDRPIRPDMQEIMVRRLPPPVEVIRLDSGHLLPVTSPAVLAQIVNRVAA